MILQVMLLFLEIVEIATMSFDFAGAVAISFVFPSEIDYCLSENPVYLTNFGCCFFSFACYYDFVEVVLLVYFVQSFLPYNYYPLLI